MNSSVDFSANFFITFRKEIKPELISNIDKLLKLNKSIQYLLDENVENKDDFWITEQYKSRLK